MFCNFIRMSILDSEKIKEKAKKVEDRKQFVKGLKVDSLPPIHRRKLNMKLNNLFYRSRVCIQWRGWECPRNRRKASNTVYTADDLSEAKHYGN